MMQTMNQTAAFPIIFHIASVGAAISSVTPAHAIACWPSTRRTAKPAVQAINSTGSRSQPFSGNIPRCFLV